MQLYKLLSVLLCYPERELIDNLAEVRQLLSECTDVAALEPLLQKLESEDLISLQESYVQTFDRTPTHSLHLFEHVHGEDRSRGSAMVDLMEEYKEAGFDIVSDELPDYLPMFLEFLSVIDNQKAQALLGSAVHVINHVGKKLTASESPYAVVFDALVSLSPIIPQALTEPPVRDMDEALEKFGPGADGIEPLLQNNMLGCSIQNASNACNTYSNVKRESK